MNKKNFLCGLGAKLALAAVALTTITFTSCEKEDFSIEVIKNPAKVTLNTTVMYFNEIGASSDVTSKATITYNGGTNNIFVGTDAQLDLNQEVEVKAEYKGVSKTEKVKVVATANQTFTQNVTIFLVDNELEIVSNVKNKSENKQWSKPANGHGYTHDGQVWNENPNSFYVIITGTYKAVDKQTIKGEPTYASNVDEKFTTLAKGVVAGMQWNKENETEYEFKASAYSIFHAWYTTTTENIDYSILVSETKEVVATFNADKISTSGIDWEEKAHPNHAGHYQPGHGHGHGDASNAGGGIIFAD